MKGFKIIVFAVLIFSMVPESSAQTGKTNSSEAIKNLITKKREFNDKYGYGFRIQIYYGNEDKARKMKTNFKTAFPKTASYLVYEQPYWKVLVGDYKNKLQADKASIEFSEKFAGLIIVPLGK